MAHLIRGSTDLHLSPEGREDIREKGKLLQKCGGLWRIYSSTQSRAVESAHLITANSANTTFMMPSKNLESWALGGLEGQPIEKVLPEIKDLVAKKPWVVPVGMGEKSTRIGESFNQFKTRVIDEIRCLMDVFIAHPTKRIGVVTHFHDVRLVEAWLAEYEGDPGPNDDLYDSSIYNEDRGEPGDIHWLRKRGNTWKMNLIDLKNCSLLLPGIYFIRHGATGWN